MADRYQATVDKSCLVVFDNEEKLWMCECSDLEAAELIALALNTMAELKTHSEQFGRL